MTTSWPQAARAMRSGSILWMAAKIGFILEVLDEVAIAAGKDTPVHIPGIITGTVLAVFSKLDRESVVGTAMQAIPEAFDHHAGAQLEIADGHQGLGIDERAG